MGIYFNLISRNGEVVISRIKILFIGTIWENILRENGKLGEYECMEMGKEYPIDINEFPKIIEYYEDVMEKSAIQFPEVYNNGIIEPLKKQLEYRISEYKEYVIILD